jgi:hypothetical protein
MPILLMSAYGSVVAICVISMFTSIFDIARGARQ